MSTRSPSTTMSTAPKAGSRPISSTGCKQLTGGKPVLVSEWFFAATQNRTGNRNNGHLMTVETQAERAAGAAAAAENFAAIPELVGAHWFQYYDYPQGGRADGEDYDFGLVDINDQPYRRLAAALARGQPRAADIHEAAGRQRPARLGRFAVPRADDRAAHAFADRLAEAGGLLPPLTASPGAVAFGEAYLALERARAAAGDHRPGLLRPRPPGL